MLIRPFSDVHVEFKPFDFQPLDTDSDTVCVLAGDVGVVDRISQISDLLDELSARFRAVIYVCGNHEHYHGSILRSYDKLNKMITEQGFSNVHLLENQSVVLDDVAFVGATLWTDFDNANPLFMFNIQRMMNDYRVIRVGTAEQQFWRALRPNDVLQLHAVSRQFIFDEAAKMKAAGYKTVIVTHHGVTPSSIDPKLKGNEYNGAYMSDLSEYILDTEPTLMLHGHIHTAVDYTVGVTRIITNPRGYPMETGPNGFDPKLVLEV